MCALAKLGGLPAGARKSTSVLAAVLPIYWGVPDAETGVEKARLLAFKSGFGLGDPRRKRGKKPGFCPPIKNTFQHCRPGRTSRPTPNRHGAAVPWGQALLGVVPLLQSHLAVRHLIRELELKGRPARRLNVPEWLKTLLCNAADDFNPASETARAGYECRLTEQGWEASLFLGASEVVGGALDGQLQAMSFQFDVLSLMRRFDRVDLMEWSVASMRDGQETADSLVTLEGVACGEPLRLQIRSTPIAEAQAGMRRHQDGRVELT
jgi:hypothetical protein